MTPEQCLDDIAVALGKLPIPLAEHLQLIERVKIVLAALKQLEEKPVKEQGIPLT